MLQKKLNYKLYTYNYKMFFFFHCKTEYKKEGITQKSKTKDGISNKEDNIEHCGSGRMATSKEDIPMRKNSQLTELNWA